MAKFERTLIAPPDERIWASGLTVTVEFAWTLMLPAGGLERTAGVHRDRAERQEADRGVLRRDRPFNRDIGRGIELDRTARDARRNGGDRRPRAIDEDPVRRDIHSPAPERVTSSRNVVVPVPLTCVQVWAATVPCTVTSLAELIRTSRSSAEPMLPLNRMSPTLPEASVRSCPPAVAP